jgi:hypothetical protein
MKENVQHTCQLSNIYHKHSDSCYNIFILRYTTHDLLVFVSILNCGGNAQHLYMNHNLYLKTKIRKYMLLFIFFEHTITVGFEVLTAVVLKRTILWDITPPACHPLSRWFLAQLIFRPWRWRRYVPPKRRLTLNRLHGVISQKMVLFIP